MRSLRYRLSNVLLVAVLSAVFVNVTNAGELEDDVLASQDARFRAMIEEDLAKLNGLLVDDLHYSHTRGNVESKAQFLSTIESKRIDYLAAKRRDVEVRLFGNTAVVTGLSDMDLIVRGEHMIFTIRFLEVSRRVDTNWQLVAWQSVRFGGD
jgi:hypothetical protein